MIKRNLVMIYKIEGAVSYSCYMCFTFANKKKKTQNSRSMKFQAKFGCPNFTRFYQQY